MLQTWKNNFKKRFCIGISAKLKKGKISSPKTGILNTCHLIGNKRIQDEMKLKSLKRLP